MFYAELSFSYIFFYLALYFHFRFQFHWMIDSSPIIFVPPVAFQIGFVKG